jgi:hypothetical protein
MAQVVCWSNGARANLSLWTWFKTNTIGLDARNRIVIDSKVEFQCYRVNPCHR